MRSPNATSVLCRHPSDEVVPHLPLADDLHALDFFAMSIVSHESALSINYLVPAKLSPCSLDGNLSRIVLGAIPAYKQTNKQTNGCCHYPECTWEFSTRFRSCRPVWSCGSSGTARGIRRRWCACAERSTRTPGRPRTRARCAGQRRGLNKFKVN